jgi:cell volume regulation protein A
VPGVVLGAVLAFVVRPILVGLCLTGSGLRRNERAFVLFAGLTGAVPILLGSSLLAVAIPDTQRLYGIVIVVVVFSVVVQGSFVPEAARRLRVPMRLVDAEPWALGVRLPDDPGEPYRTTVVGGSYADGAEIRDLADDVWISVVLRAGQLVALTGSTVLRAGDEVVALDGRRPGERAEAIFDHPATPQV